MADYFHSPQFIIDWNSGRREAFKAYYDAYWSRIYMIHHFYLNDSKEEKQIRAVITFEEVFKQSIGSFDELLQRTIRTARKLAFPLENPKQYNPTEDHLRVEYIYQLRGILEERFGPFDHEPSDDEIKAMVQALKKKAP